MKSKPGKSNSFWPAPSQSKERFTTSQSNSMGEVVAAVDMGSSHRWVLIVSANLLIKESRNQAPISTRRGHPGRGTLALSSANELVSYLAITSTRHSPRSGRSSQIPSLPMASKRHRSEQRHAPEKRLALGNASVDPSSFASTSASHPVRSRAGL